MTTAIKISKHSILVDDIHPKLSALTNTPHGRLPRNKIKIMRHWLTLLFSSGPPHCWGIRPLSCSTIQWQPNSREQTARKSTTLGNPVHRLWAGLANQGAVLVSISERPNPATFPTRPCCALHGAILCGVRREGPRGSTFLVTCDTEVLMTPVHITHSHPMVARGPSLWLLESQSGANVSHHWPPKVAVQGHERDPTPGIRVMQIPRRVAALL